jgi:hypothetical protein
MTYEHRLYIRLAIQHAISGAEECLGNARKQWEETGDEFWQDSIRYWSGLHDKYAEVYLAFINSNTHK